MSVLELYDLSQVHVWLEATNNLLKTAYLETNAAAHRFIPFSTPLRETSRYYLYQDLDAGLCGSMELAQLATDRVVQNTLLRQGTWIIKDSFFFVRDDHPSSAIGIYEPLIRTFYQHIFVKVCSLSLGEALPFALTSHRFAHGDFLLLSDLTFQAQWAEMDWVNDQRTTFGLFHLEDQPQYTSLFLNRREKKPQAVNRFFNDNLCLMDDRRKPF